MDPLTPLLLDSQVEAYKQQGYLRVSQFLTNYHLNAIANELGAFQRGEKTSVSFSTQNHSMPTQSLSKCP